ncbi:hypothetical protein B0T22DRAFT_310988 [Podospora appendiculata]|uniref:Uncharacterized protein n=1 Tax=Podospora appendiculata TaxID=314037 RepID=A0AAE1C765_9PEZI|nr:hypothetical protein B0T22DRAFT_310988 [Podospora appendiculata]
MSSIQDKTPSARHFFTWLVAACLLCLHCTKKVQVPKSKSCPSSCPKQAPSPHLCTPCTPPSLGLVLQTWEPCREYSYPVPPDRPRARANKQNLENIEAKPNTHLVLSFPPTSLGP